MPAVDGGVSGDGSQSGTASSSQPDITMATAPDLLARMLVRAAGVDARINGVSASANGANAQGTGAAHSPSAISARLQALFGSIASNATSVASSNGSQSGSQTTYGFDQFASQQSDSTQDSSNASVLGTPGVSFSTQVQNAVQNAASAAQPVDTSAVIEQLVKGMSMRTNAQGSSEIRLHLQPENLGDVTMKITVSGSQISATAIASNTDVRNTLMSNHHQLARSLADAGLTLSGFTVDVSGGDTGRQGQNQDRTAGFGRRYTVHELRGAPSSESPALSTLAPPILSGPGLELFNYLA
jgi:flagellar hook-length control protein FliK